ncbi:heme exporter protein CcmB [Alcanivorax sp. 1008]|uniref:heme exporter protein CcmB n=1 Tax=Alcanivorax sp. 1008 TaxID=2816853 RepID=UPI001D9995D5|nr:heme exporter protein CcmB [Alcanivorax sp. 1008]MCC1497104.1 heme exporter protein CcmB [Alcanivorax sp. 1008]MDF1629355.1 heme exporter protein CcmB [Alcanivoracaceae bacterium]
MQRELLLAWRRPAEIINPLFFFVMVVALFPLGVSPRPELLATLAPGVVWVAALLAVLLSVDGLFRADHDSGALEQLLTAPQSLYVPVLAKLAAHWMLTGLPLVVMAPLLGYMLHLPEQAIGVLFIAVLLGTPTLVAIGAIGAALTVSLRSGGILLSLLVLPLYVPVLVFGAGVVSYAAKGLPVSGVLALLGAMMLASFTLAPAAVAAGLRISSGN